MKTSKRLIELWAIKEQISLESQNETIKETLLRVSKHAREIMAERGCYYPCSEKNIVEKYAVAEQKVSYSG